MLGERLHSELTSESKVAKPYVKGRNTESIKARNHCILYRYYYYSKIKRLSYLDTLTLICSEFFIAERTTIAIIQNNSKTLKEIFAEAATSKILEQKFIYLNWKI